MLADPKARRLSTEFFGQWLGFYHFDQYRGVDTSRFPEFTDEVKAAMYDEAVSFFEYIVRKDRPVQRDALRRLHVPQPAAGQVLRHQAGHQVQGPTSEMVEGADAFHRGGLLRLGAVLTATSAPLRTSPGEARRLGAAPHPRHPAAAAAGQRRLDSGRRQALRRPDRAAALEAHKRNATCASCHSRIDPLGFPLEHYDSIGRWRDTYSDGKADRRHRQHSPTRPTSTGVDGLLELSEDQGTRRSPHACRTSCSATRWAAPCWHPTSR